MTELVDEIAATVVLNGLIPREDYRSLMLTILADALRREPVDYNGRHRLLVAHRIFLMIDGATEQTWQEGLLGYRYDDRYSVDEVSRYSLDEGLGTVVQVRIIETADA